MRWTATAPTRICDAGGWTDTWFAGHGRVVNLAVEPRAVATVVASERRGAQPQVVLHVRDFGETYTFDVEALVGRHPLLEHAIAAAGVPENTALDVRVSCGAPAGASMGTSASLVVALVAALDAAVHGVATMAASAIVARAHEVETVRVGRQAGVQDQLAAVYGGACDIRVHAFPDAHVERIDVSRRFVTALDAALVTVYLGSHDSSAVHREVIAALEGEGTSSGRLEALRRVAAEAARALRDEDLDAFAAALTANTEAQAALHDRLVGSAATEVIDLARRSGALGWKVNGAGGEGGSVTVVCRGPQRAHVVDALRANGRPEWRLVPTRLAAMGVDVRVDANEGRPWPPLV